MKQRPSISSVSSPSASASASASSLVLLLLKLQLISYMLLLSFHHHVTITTALTISPTTMDDGRKFVLKYTLAKVQEENNNNEINQEDMALEPPSVSCIQYKLPNPSDEEEDELEMLYPTSKSMFVFDDNSDEVTVRTTSFGCGKLGFEIWTASIFLSLYCRSVLLPKIENNADKTTKTTTIVEIGAGCGLPSSTLARYPSESQLQVIATDFWMEPNDEFDKERLIPDYYHGVNLKYNIEQNSVRNCNPHFATAKRLDWINPKPFIDDVDNVDWVIGSDVIYYPQDLHYLWNTLDVFLKHGTKVIIAATADKRREALPDFINQLDAKQKSNSLKVNKEEWILYQQGTEDDNDDKNGGIREVNRFYCFCFEKA